MRIEGRRQSDNVEDRRGQAATGGGGGGPRKAGLGIGGIVLVIAFWALGGDPEVAMEVLEAVDASQQGSASTAPVRRAPPADDALGAFVGVVLADTEAVWHEQFEVMGRSYVEPKLVLFEDKVDSACGLQSSAVGPFYCSADQKAYIDLSFYDQLRSRFGAPGDFAQAYVLAHEVGHHVQTLLGTRAAVRDQQRGLAEAESNQLAVRLELQADCYAGLWAHHAHTKRQMLEDGDVEEGLKAATAIGDDTLQKQAQGFAVPESFTHGSSAQRVRWFTTGLQKGSVAACDTFAGPYDRL